MLLTDAWLSAAPPASNWINGSIFKFSHVVDELDALTLILEGWVGKCLPAAVLTLIFVGWPLNVQGFCRKRRIGINPFA